jgi:hypothetical protein
VVWKEDDLGVHQTNSRRRAKHAPVRPVGDWKRDVRQTVLIDVIAVKFFGEFQAQEYLNDSRRWGFRSTFSRLQCSFQAVASSHHPLSPREPAPTMISTNYNNR